MRNIFDGLSILISFIVIAFIFGKIRSWILKTFYARTKEQVKEFGCSIGNRYKKNGKEVFAWRKLGKAFSIIDPVAWIKDLVSIFNVRKLTIYAIILGSVYAYGVYNTKSNTPVSIDLNYGQETVIELKKGASYLHIDTDGAVYLKDGDGNVVKRISVKDIAGLKKKLAPLALQLKPIAIVGISGGTRGFDAEGGVGISWLRAWKARMDSFITNRGIYTGISYKLDGLHMRNSAIGLAVGEGFEKFGEDHRAIAYWSVRF